MVNCKRCPTFPCGLKLSVVLHVPQPLRYKTQSLSFIGFFSDRALAHTNVSESTSIQYTLAPLPLVTSQNCRHHDVQNSRGDMASKALEFGEVQRFEARFSRTGVQSAQGKLELLQPECSSSVDCYLPTMIHEIGMLNKGSYRQ